MKHLSDIMLSELLVLDLIAHVCVFSGSLYLVIYNTAIPRYCLTSLWYVGVCSIFVSFTICFEFLFGDDFGLSYSNVGRLGEVAFNISIAVTALLLLIVTVRERQWISHK